MVYPVFWNHSVAPMEFSQSDVKRGLSTLPGARVYVQNCMLMWQRPWQWAMAGRGGPSARATRAIALVAAPSLESRRSAPRSPGRLHAVACRCPSPARPLRPPICAPQAASPPLAGRWPPARRQPLPKWPPRRPAPLGCPSHGEILGPP